MPWALDRVPDIDVSGVETPCTICDLGILERNLRVLADVMRRSGCKILLALKGFAMWSVFPLVSKHLAGVAASSPDEARLGRELLGREVHAYAPAYDEASFSEILRYADTIIFNSFAQWHRLRPLAEGHSGVRFGLRINPEHSEVAVAIYDPCAPGSRLGVTRRAFAGEPLEGLSGLHFHTLAELGADALERTVAAVEAGFGAALEQVQWVSFGGGHHITRDGYDVELLVRIVQRFAARYGVQVYLEPGEAVALNAGVLVASVLDIIAGEPPNAILDTSAAAHLPDVLEMPYRPEILGAGRPGDSAFTYRLGGLTCLAGDVIGDYSFPRPLAVGDKLVFLDMGHYTMVKSNTFNGVRLPSIATHDPATGRLEVVRRFGYEDYKSRLS